MVASARRLVFHELAVAGSQVQTNVLQKLESGLVKCFSLNCAPFLVPGTGVFSLLWTALSSLTSENATTELPLRKVLRLLSQPLFRS